MKVKKEVRIKLESGERVEVYTRAGTAKTTATYYGPGSITVVRYSIAERKDTKK